jgi:hypothetical protein
MLASVFLLNSLRHCGRRPHRQQRLDHLPPTVAAWCGRAGTAMQQDHEAQQQEGDKTMTAMTMPGA